MKNMIQKIDQTNRSSNYAIDFLSLTICIAAQWLIEQGKYKLSLGKNGTYKMQISYIGMKTFEENLVTKESDMVKDYKLQLDNALNEVEVIYKMPITVSGDTLTYNADSFKNGTERKLEDVLEKLPGVEKRSNNF